MINTLSDWLNLANGIASIVGIIVAIVGVVLAHFANKTAIAALQLSKFDHKNNIQPRLSIAFDATYSNPEKPSAHRFVLTNHARGLASIRIISSMRFNSNDHKYDYTSSVERILKEMPATQLFDRIVPEKNQLEPVQIGLGGAIAYIITFEQDDTYDKDAPKRTVFVLQYIDQEKELYALALEYNKDLDRHLAPSPVLVVFPKPKNK